MTHSAKTVSESQSVWLPRSLVVISILISLVMIACVYRNLSPTWDEPSHIANGVSWLTPPHRLLDPVNPPVARISAGIGPWLFGAKTGDADESGELGNRVLKDDGHYKRTTTLARLGILPWYLLAVYLVWSMTRRWLGEWPAALAAMLFIFTPPVLANASLATTDIPFVATFLLAVDRIWIALREPRWGNYALAGVAAALTCATKMSGLPFTFACALIFVAYLWFLDRKLPRLSRVAFTAAVMALTIWAVYRFQMGPLVTIPASRAHMAKLAAKAGPLSPVVISVADHVPAYQFFQGIRRVRSITKNWQPKGYLLGQTYSHGKWYFFPVMLLVKSPVPVLILGLAGLWLALRRLISGSDRFAVVPVVGLVIPVLIAMTSRENIGVRHVLAAFAFLAMLSALAAQRLLAVPTQPKEPAKDSYQFVKAAALGLLIAWNVLACAIATPDFLTWYNEPTAPWASLIHVDSDYDWGQDLWRLSDKLRTLPVDSLWLSYNGSVDVNEFHLPPWKPLPSGVPEKGWIAISETNYRMEPEAFGWLAAYKPVAIAGKTIRIYDIP